MLPPIMHAPDTGAHKQRTGSRRTSPRHRTDEQGSEVVARVLYWACGRADGVQMMCSTERLVVRLHAQVCRSLTVICCGVDIINMDIIVSWDIGTERYGLLESLSVDFARRKKSHQPSSVQSGATT